ncbi:hypothetical protein BCR42DRAFT_416001 [Absidia repens]|uniref:Uncharacterized protein n=1 Tax=Absidia repens TaxID=90262 RepID=A0A1X2IFY5_9FUNG|nr:hypothetical protein BCR42DRAFT_416001 [Absidia repens]
MRLFQSKTVEDNDLLSYHFKEQCKVQRRINATMPHLKSLHDQPSVRVKANGAIVLNRYHHHHTSIPSDWVPTVVSCIKDEDIDGDYAYDGPNNDFENSVSEFSTISSSQSFLSATPLRKRASSTSSSYDYHFPYERKLDILLEEMEDVQQEGARMKKNYLLMEQRNTLLEKELNQRDELINSLQSKIQSLMDPSS